MSRESFKKFTNDLEIIDILKQFPRFEESGNKTIFQLLDEKPGQDYGVVVTNQKTVWTLLKFGYKNRESSETGLILYKCQDDKIPDVLEDITGRISSSFPMDPVQLGKIVGTLEGILVRRFL